MTYRELLIRLVCLDKDQLDSDVTIYCTDWDELIPADTFAFADDLDDELGENHPYITTRTIEEEWGP